MVAIGDATDIMIDFHGRTYPAMTIQYINAIEEYCPYFCEEPVPPENEDALPEVRENVKVPIATGERLVTRHQFRRIFETRAFHIIQPDLCGGLFEARKMATGWLLNNPDWRLKSMKKRLKNTPFNRRLCILQPSEPEMERF